MFSDTVHVSTNVMAQPIATRLIAMPRDIFLFKVLFLSQTSDFKILSGAEYCSDSAEERSGGTVHREDIPHDISERREPVESEHLPYGEISGKQREHGVVDKPREPPRRGTGEDTDEHTLNEERSLDEPRSSADIPHYRDFVAAREHAGAYRIRHDNDADNDQCDEHSSSDEREGVAYLNEYACEVIGGLGLFYALYVVGMGFLSR